MAENETLGLLSTKQLQVPRVQEMYKLAERLTAGEKFSEFVEPDTIPSADYRQRIERILMRLGLIESFGGPYFFNMIQHAPSPGAAEALAHIAAEEIGHGRMLLECLDPLGVEYRSAAREQYVATAEARKEALKLSDPGLNGPKSWEDVLAVTLLVDPAGILLVGARTMSQYGPLARVSAETLIEERDHAAYWEIWGKEILASDEGRASLQRSVDKVYPGAMGSLGRPEAGNTEFIIEREMGIWTIDPAELQDILREMLEVTLPPLGLRIPDLEPDYRNAFW